MSVLDIALVEEPGVADLTLTARFDLPPDLNSPALGRTLTTDLLRGWGCTRYLDDAAVIVSELITNAVVHATQGHAVELTLTCSADGRVRISVLDESIEAAIPRQVVPDEAESGRGLTIIAAYSSAWGSLPVRGGKQIWAQLG